MPLFRRDPQTKFVKTAEQAIRGLGYDDALTFDEELFAFRLAGDRLIMLGNIHGHYQSLPQAEGGEYLTAALAGLLQEADTPKTFDEARHRLFPGVRDRAYMESARLMSELGGNPPIPIPHRPLGSTMVALLVVDSPISMMTVNEQHLSDWGSTFDDALATATQNLLIRSADATWGRVADGVYASIWNDDYDASRLLVGEVVDEVARDLGIAGDPVAFVPHRNLLILTGSDDVAGLIAAMGLTEENLDKPSQISARPIVRREGQWEGFELARDHPAAPGLRRLQQADLALAHGALVPLIQQIVGDEIFAANFLLAEKDDVLYSSTAWSEGVPAIIPKTDRILFFRSQEETWMVEWDEAARVVGDLLEPTGYYPTRFRVSSFPTDEQLAAMRLLEGWQSEG